MVIKKILESIFEQDFVDMSTGFGQIAVATMLSRR